MNKEEAIKFFELQTQDEQALIDGINLNPDDFVFGAEGPEQYINDCQNNIDAYNTAITALRGPWVKTTDRLPTKEDADDEGKVTALITGMLTGKLLSLSLYYASVTAESADYFLPMPKLPEVEE